MGPVRHIHSALLGKRWSVPLIGSCRLVVPSLRSLEVIDEDWPPRRRPGDVHQHWRWRELVRGKRERFALLHGNRTLALWSGLSRRLRLQGAAYYRLDFIEVAPEERQWRLGAFVLGLSVGRAMEIGCQGLVLASFPETAKVYERLGGLRAAASCG